MIFVKQKWEAPWQELTHRDLTNHLGILSPLLVESQEEKDYLLGLQLILGYEFRVLLDGIDENPEDIPPTWVRIPELNQ